MFLSVQVLEALVPELPAAESFKIKEVLSDVRRVCHEASEGESNVENNFMLIGAYHLGAILPGDVITAAYVVPIDASLRVLCGTLATRFQTQLQATDMRPAHSNGHLAATGLAFTLCGHQVKLLLAQRVPNIPLPRANAIVSQMAALYSHETIEKLLNTVPDKEAFRSLVRFVRFWAKQRGVKGTYLGFLGTLGWAVCCARVCQMHAQADLHGLVFNFFHTMSSWDWNLPLTIVHGDDLEMPLVHPKNREGRMANIDVMLPVGEGIPAAPYSSATTSSIMREELLRAYNILEAQIPPTSLPTAVGITSSHDDEGTSLPQWRKLLCSAKFYKRYRHYIQLEFMASNEELLNKWFGWAVAQVTKFVVILESRGAASPALRPWPEVLRFDCADWPHARALFVGLHRHSEKTPKSIEQNFDFREPVMHFMELLEAWPEADQYEDQFDFAIAHVRKEELKDWLQTRSLAFLGMR